MPGAVWWAALGLVTSLLLTGCAGGDPPPPTSSTASAAPARPITAPDDGLLLGSFGFRNGPIGAFSLPRTTIFTALADQPANVSAVIASPSTPEVFDYLQRTLPPAGFTIVRADRAAGSMTFAGPGWTGSFTGDERACAVVLRPT